MKSNSWTKLLALCSLSAILFLGNNVAFAAANNGDGWLGVQIQELNTGLKKALGLEKRDGVLVNQVMEDSPAAAAGIQEGDVILTFDGKTITSANKLSRLVRKTEPGQNVAMELWRDAKSKSVTVRIAEQDRDTSSYTWSMPGREFSIISPGRDRLRMFFGGANVYLGVELAALTDQALADYFGAKEDGGALVLSVSRKSPAKTAGMLAGDVIVDIDGETVHNPEDVQEILRDYDANDTIKLGILRKSKKLEITVTLENNDPNLHNRREIERKIFQIGGSEI